MKPILFLIPVVVALAACDRAERAELRKESREAVQEVKEAAVDLKESAGELKDRVTNDPRYEATKLKVKGTWFEAKGKLKQKYAELTDDDLLYEEGKEDEVYGKVQKRLGKSREEVEKIFEEL